MMKRNLTVVFLLVALTALANARLAVHHDNMLSDPDTTAPKIIFITDDDLDDINVNFLKRQGFDVTKMWFPAGLSSSIQDTIDLLNSADLVIIGRSGSSMFFRDSADKAVWNGLTSPQLLICPWKARKSRLNWFDSYTQYSISVPTKTNDGFVLEPNDPIFDDVTLTAGNSLEWTYLSDDYICVSSPSNGTWLVNRGDTIPLLVRFEPNIPFYPGATDSAAGPRTYFGMGTEAYESANFFPLTRDAKKIFLAEICRMMDVPVPEIVYGAPDFSITLVTDDDYDRPCITFLQKQGFRVKTFWPPNRLGAAGQDTIDMLNAEDLIIIGRSGGSINFQQPADKAAWNGLTSPQILNCPWKARNTRLNWFNVSTGNSINPYIYGTFTAVAIDPDDPVFEFATGIASDGFIAEWSFNPNDYILLKQPSNGDWIVNRGDSIPLVVRFEPNMPFYPGASDSAAGKRVYFGMGNDANGPNNFFPLTKTGQAVYFAEALRLVGAPTYEPVYLREDRSLATLNVSTGTLTPAFNKDSLNYTVALPEGTQPTDSVQIIATATEATSIVTGTGWVKVPNLSNNVTITCTAENARPLYYRITFTRPPVPKIIFVTDDDLEDNNINFLKRQGFDVTKMWFPAGLGAATQDTINILNGADLVIIGRSGSSVKFLDPAAIAAWNGLTAPLLLICPWKARRYRLNWFSSKSSNVLFIPTETNDGIVVIPNDPIFDGVTLDTDNSLIWTYVSDDYLTVLEPFNGTCVVNRGDTIPLLVRFDANVPFYPGANDSASGPRTYMGMGIDSYGPSIFFPLTREAKKVYLAEICRMMDVPVPEIVYGAPDFSITLVTDDDYDKPCITFLEKQGFRVKTFWPPNGLGAVGQDTIDMLNTEDLVIIGRSGPSNSFQQPADKAAWNGLTSPQILNCPWKARNTRLNWFSVGISNAINPYHEGTSSAIAINPDDPVFEFAPGVEASGFIPEWSFHTDDFIIVMQPSNGEWIVRWGDSIPRDVRFEPNVPFYPGAIDSAAGERVYFGMGNDANGPNNFFPLTKTGQAVYFAEAMRLVGAPAYEPLYIGTDRTLSSLTVSAGILDPPFDKEIMDYEVNLPAGTSPEDSVEITATATESTSVVRGTGWIKVPNPTNRVYIFCTAENANQYYYRITFNRPTGVEETVTTTGSCDIYPNPVNDKLVISAADAINNVTIYNLQGVALMSRIVDSRSVELPVSSLNTGIYFIKVQSGNNIYIRKITKE